MLALLCPLALAETDAGLWRFVHPNAKALIGIDVRAIRSSEIVGQLSAQMHGLPLAAGFPLQLAGFDIGPWRELIDSVDRVVVSSPGRDPADPKQEPPLLIAVAGHFAPVKLSHMFLKAGCKPQSFDSVTIYRPQDSANSDFGFVILNSQTLLIGDVKSLFAVIDRLQKTDTPAPAIVQRAHDLDTAYDFWAVLLMPPAAISGDRLPIGDLTGPIGGLQAGIAVRNGFEMEIQLNTNSPKDAKNIAAQCARIVHLAAKDHQARPELAGLDKKLKIVVDRSDVHFALRLNAGEVNRMAKAFREVHGSRAELQASANAPAPPQPAAKPVQRQVIRIEGLDDGPREIPYPNK